MKKKLLFAILLLLISFNVHAQILPFQIYSIENGLSQSVVTDIIQDKYGYFWFGTQDGLNKFDGINFKVYGQSDGLQVTEITTIAEDSHGYIWAGTEEGGLYRINGDSIKNFMLGSDALSNTIKSIFKNASNELFSLNRKGEIWKLENNDIKPLVTDVSYLGSKNAFANDAVIDKTGTFWIATSEDGLVKIKESNIKKYGFSDGLPTKDIQSLLLDSKGRLWVGTDGKGIYLFENEEFKSVLKDDSFQNEKITVVYEDKSGGIWLGSDNGICQVKNDKCRMITAKNGLPYDAVYTIYEGREGYMWFGTYAGGVAQLLTEMFNHYNKEVGLVGNQVYAISENDNGEILLGTSSGGVNFLNKNNGITVDKKLNEYTGDEIYSVIKTRAGAVWISTYGNGVIRLKNNEITKYTTKDGLSSNKIYCAFEDRDGKIWLGTEFGLSVFQNGIFENFTRENGFDADHVNFITGDRDGNLWLSTSTDGLIKYKNGNLQKFTTKDGLASNSIYYIFEDRDGVLWIGTNNGLSKYVDGKFTNYSTKDGLSNKTCYFIGQDNRGFLWIGTNLGLNRFDGKDFRVYTTKDGLMTNEFTEGAVFKDSSGDLWFGNIEGVTKFIPELDVANNVSPDVYITGIRLFDNPITLAKHDPFKYNENYFKYSYVSPYFYAASELKYKYMLEGVDMDWQISSSRDVQYTSLGAGKYKFKVMAINKDGLESENIADYSFSITPPFWKRLWFMAVCALAVGLLIFAYYKYKMNKIRKQNIELENTVHERTKDLEKEKEKSDELLCNILPKVVVDEIKEKGASKPKRFDNVTIVFTDFKGFTNTSSVMPAEALIAELNDLFVHFDDIINDFGLEKIKTIGDAYMIAGGLPTESKDHAMNCIKAATKMQDYVHDRNKDSIIKWNMRVGVHSGNVVAGVVGKVKFTYDVWGDTVNIASRMESSCEPGRVNISAFSYFLVKDQIECEYRGKIDIKGKGEIDMYYVQ